MADAGQPRRPGAIRPSAQCSTREQGFQGRRSSLEGLRPHITNPPPTAIAFNVTYANPAPSHPPPLRGDQQRLVEVAASQVRACAIGEGDGDTRCPGGDIEDGGRLNRSDLPDELLSPPPVLSKGEDLRQQVVTLRQAAEEGSRKRVLRTR